MKSIFLIIGLIGFISCKKDTDNGNKGPNCQAQPAKYIESENQNFKFKVGTFWVFRDTVTSLTDTMKVVAISSNGLVHYQYCPNNYHEYYSFDVNRAYGTTGSTNDRYSIDENGFMLNQMDESGLGSFVYTSSLPKIDSMFIYDRYYKSIVKTVKGDITLYYNAAYGLLKREYKVGTTVYSNKILKDKVIIR